MRQRTASTLGFAFEPFQNLRVGQMAAIPSEQVVGGNGGGNGQMHGVASGFGRQATCGEEEAGQFQAIQNNFDDIRARLIALTPLGLAVSNPPTHQGGW